MKRICLSAHKVCPGIRISPINCPAALNQEKEGLEQDVRDNEKRAAENERRIKELRQQAAKVALL